MSDLTEYLRRNGQRDGLWLRDADHAERAVGLVHEGHGRIVLTADGPCYVEPSDQEQEHPNRGADEEFAPVATDPAEREAVVNTKNIDVQRIARQAQPIFALNGWSYGLNDSGTPTVSDLEGTVQHLLDTIDDKPDVDYTATGRFVVTRDRDSDGNDEGISVSLELDSTYVWDNER